MIIKNKSDWWYCVNENWSHLNAILWRFLPMDGCEIIEDGKVTLSVERMSQHVEKLRGEQSQDLWNYFQAAWMAAPDSPDIHRIPKWGLLCDLCSEQWVFNPESEEA